MKIFKWKMTKPLSSGGAFKHTFMETWTEYGEEMYRFWAILDPIDGGYVPYIHNKDRSGYQTIEEALSLEDARLAVERELFDRGTMDEGDLVIYDGDD